MDERVRLDGVSFKVGDKVEVTNPLAELQIKPPLGYIGVITAFTPDGRACVHPKLPGDCFNISCFSHANTLEIVNESILKIQEFLKTKKHGVDYIINKNGLFEEPKKGETSEAK